MFRNIAFEVEEITMNCITPCPYNEIERVMVNSVACQDCHHYNGKNTLNTILCNHPEIKVEENTMDKEYRKGDVVCIKGQSVIMTVIEVLNKNEVKVLWFDKDIITQQCLISTDLLYKVEW